MKQKPLDKIIIPNMPVTEGGTDYNLASYIKHCREKENFTTSLGARFLELSEQDYIRLEDGNFPITAEMLLLLIKVYNMPKRLKSIIQSPDRPLHAKRITELRIKENRTQTETSKLLDVAQTTYSGYETGRTEPDIKTLIKIADLYNTTVDIVIGHDLQQN
jgi:transcriptional regulator with XRE-family HTH domain